MKENTNKFGFWSIVLLGINGIVGTGIFLLPNKAYAMVGTASLGVLFFDAILAICIALCFAEAASFFKRNGGPYLYAKHSLGDFAGYEVGILKWIVTLIAWATMAVGLATVIQSAIPALVGDFYKNILATIIVGSLTILNLFGVKTSRLFNNIMTISKLLPLVLFIVIGLFFINGSNFTPTISQETLETGSLASAALLLFFAYTGFEALAVAAEDMDNPKKNLPKAIIITMVLVTIIYMAILAVCIGVMGSDLANTKTPIQDAFMQILGPAGMYIVLIGTILSMAGINMAEAFYAPRITTALAQDGMMPTIFDKRNRYDVPYIAAIITAALTILLTWTGSFTQLAAISAVSRFTQMVPTILAVIIFRKKWPNKERSYKIPLGITIPIIAIVITLWMLTNATSTQLIWGLGGIVVIAPFYYFYWNKKRKGFTPKHDDLT